MDNSTLLWGVIPLLFFVIFDTLVGPKAALISLFLAALLEAILTIHLFGELDWVTGLSFILVILLALVSYKMKKQIYVKFQPVILGVVLGVVLVGSYVMNKPMLFLMFQKYKSQIPALQQMEVTNPLTMELLKISTMTVGISLILHAIVVAYAACKMSSWWWLIIRGVGVYPFMILGMLSSLLFIAR